MAAQAQGPRAAAGAPLFALDSPFTSSLSTRRWGALDTMLCGLGSAALVVCLVATSRHKYFWYDEVNSWNLVTDHSLRHMVAAIGDGADGAPPFYHVTAWLWVRLFGATELALRAWSCAGFIAALALTWATMRLRYSALASALGAGVAFGMSRLVVYQVAEARFYGLLTALVALATYWFAVSTERREIEWRLWLAIALTHAALLYTHAFGVLYSAAVLAAWIVADRRSGWWRPKAYSAVLAAWIAFGPWIPALHHAAGLAVRGSWIAVPSPSALLMEYGFRIDRLSPIVTIGMALMGIGIVGQMLRDRPRDGVRRAHRGVAGLLLALLAVIALGICDARISGSSLSPAAMLRAPSGFLLAALYVAALYRSTRQRTAQGPRLPLIAGTLFAIPIVAFAISHLALSVFLDRYLLPCTIGVAIAIAALTDEVLGGLFDGTAPFRSRAGMAWDAAWIAFAAVLLLHPALRGLEAAPASRPGAEIEAVVPERSLIVVESPLDFMPLAHYQERPDLVYVLATGPSSARRDLPSHEDFIYNYMGVLESHGYVRGAGNDGTQRVCMDAPFLIDQAPQTRWVARALAQSAEIAFRPWGTRETRLLVAEPRGVVCLDGVRAR